MLISFRASNYRSIKEEVVLSLLATRLDEGVGMSATVADDGTTVDILPVIAILGANASGKSNLLRAMAFMREMVLTSGSRGPHSDLPGDPFRLDSVCAEKPTLMEITFELKETRYQYGFELLGGRFIGEWLHTFPHKRAQTLFDREMDDFQFGKKLAGQNRVIADITRPKVLFLSSAAQAGHAQLSPIADYFFNNLYLLDVPERSTAASALMDRIERRHRRAVQLLSMADLGITDARIEKDSIDPAQREALRAAIKSSSPKMSDAQVEEEVEFYLTHVEEEGGPVIHLVHQAHRGVMPMPFEEESLGTKSWLSFVAHALDALDAGGVLLVDELDASLHPLLVREAIQLFQSPKSNRHGAQLIFTSHDTTMLGRSTMEGFRLSRGQFWFTEKSGTGASALVPLSDFRPRKNEDLERGYLQGRYGGTPNVLPGSSSRAVREG